MSFKIAVAGVAAAVGLGLLIGGRMRPALALRSDASVSEALADTSAGQVDLTPAYVSPASLQAWRAAETPPRLEPDRVAIDVRRDLAQADSELRASEAALEDYHRAAVLVGRAAEGVIGSAAALSSGSDPQAGTRPDQPWRATGVEAPAAASASSDQRWRQE